MPRVVSHTHRLKRHRYKSTGSAIFHCVLPDCFFKIETHLALGKKAQCWRCNKDFIINEYSLRLARPHCTACTKSKEEIPTTEEPIKPIAMSIQDDNIASLRSRMTKVIGGLAAVADDEKGEL